MSINTKKNSSSHIGYRPDIDGLRAIAVLAVILFHIDLPIHGGFTGVDVFFVISGYLITKLIYKEVTQTGNFNIIRFYSRRNVHIHII